MISIKGLKKSYGNLQVLDSIDLDIHKGEVISIIGPSGAGKSTFLRCINYLEKPEEGTITFSDGSSYDFSNLNDSEIFRLRTHSSMVFQSYALFRNKTVLENITLNLKLVKNQDSEKATNYGEKLLKRVGLLDKKDEYPNRLSGGQQQRVGIARAMAIMPEIMLFDEPTSSLDPELVVEVLNVIRDLAKEKQTMLIVTHEMEFARHVSDRVGFIADKKLIEIDTPDIVFENPKSERLKQFLNSTKMEYQ